MRIGLYDVVMVAGCAAVVAGVRLLSPAGAMIAGGVLLIGIGLLGGFAESRRSDDDAIDGDDGEAASP